MFEPCPAGSPGVTRSSTYIFGVILKGKMQYLEKFAEKIGIAHLRDGVGEAMRVEIVAAEVRAVHIVNPVQVMVISLNLPYEPSRACDMIFVCLFVFRKREEDGEGQRQREKIPS